MVSEKQVVDELTMLERLDNLLLSRSKEELEEALHASAEREMKFHLEVEIEQYKQGMIKAELSKRYKKGEI